MSAPLVAHVGAGDLLRLPDANASAVREAVHRRLTTPSYRARAAEIGAAIEAMPTAAAVASILESQVAESAGAAPKPVARRRSPPQGYSVRPSNRHRSGGIRPAPGTNRRF